MEVVVRAPAHGGGDAGVLKLMSGGAQTSGESGLTTGCHEAFDRPGA